MRPYELMVVLNAGVDETGVQDLAGRVTKYVSDHGGQLEGQDLLGKRRLAYPIGNRFEGTYFLTTFGRANRGTVCSCEVRMEPNLSQALHLLNGDTVQGKIQQGGLVKKLLDAGVSFAFSIGAGSWGAWGARNLPYVAAQAAAHLLRAGAIGVVAGPEREFVERGHAAARTVVS